LAVAEPASPPVHENPESQRLLAQQASPSPPQGVQALFPVQTLSAAQRAPLPTQVFVDDVVSQHPVLHRSPAQQGWPCPPHPAHWPDARH
jgi:hypothetical protein